MVRIISIMIRLLYIQTLRYLVDASSSTDTSNDIDGLRYVWRVDNVPTYEGSSRSIAWPDGVDDDSFVLSIEVIDDDSESSMISVVVVNNSESGSPPSFNTNSDYFWYFFIIFSIQTIKFR